MKEEYGCPCGASHSVEYDASSSYERSRSDILIKNWLGGHRSHIQQAYINLHRKE